MRNLNNVKNDELIKLFLEEGEVEFEINFPAKEVLRPVGRSTYLGLFDEDGVVVDTSRTHYVFDKNGKYNKVFTEKTKNNLVTWKYFREELLFIDINYETREYLSSIADAVDKILATLDGTGEISIELDKMVVYESRPGGIWKRHNIYVETSSIINPNLVLEEVRTLGFNESAIARIIQFAIAKKDPDTKRFYKWLIANGKKLFHIITWYEKGLKLPEAVFRWLENTEAGVDNIITIAEVYVSNNTHRNDDKFLAMIKHKRFTPALPLPRGISLEDYDKYLNTTKNRTSVYQDLHLDEPARFTPRLMVKLGRINQLLRVCLIKHNLLLAEENGWNIITNSRMDWSMAKKSRRELLAYAPANITNSLLMNRRFIDSDFNIMKLGFKNIKALQNWFKGDMSTDQFHAMVKLIRIFGNFNRAKALIGRHTYKSTARLFELGDGKVFSNEVKRLVEKHYLYYSENISKYRYMGDLTLLQETINRGLPVNNASDLRKSMLEVLLSDLTPQVRDIAVKSNISLAGCKEYDDYYKKHKGDRSYNTIPEFRHEFKNGYVYKSLDADDPMNLMVGEFTSCCQTLSNAGASCAKHAMNNVNGGIFAIYKDGVPVAQSWVWRRDDIIVLDSIEAHGSVKTKELVKIISKLPKILKEGNLKGVKEVRIGDTQYGITGEVKSELNLKPIKGKLKPKGYSGYIDGKHQVLLARL